MPAILLATWVLAAGGAPQAAAVPGAAAPARFQRLHYTARIEKDGQQTLTMEVRVVLGTSQAVSEFGQIGMPYLDGVGDVQFRDVAIEKPGGRRVDVKDGLVEDINPFGVSNTSVPADVRFRKLTIPGLEPGDTLSYRVVVKQAPLAPGRVFGEFKLAPVPGGVAQTYELDVPRGSEVRVRLREGLGAAWQEVAAPPDRLVRRLVASVEMPPDTKKPLTRAERLQWTEPDVIFTSFRSWSEVTSWWSALAKERLRPDAAVAQESSAITAPAAGARAKAEALFRFVASRIRYVNVSFGLGRMQPRAAADVLQNRYGDCKDKHALLAAMASGAGLDVRPVLVNSGREALYDDVPGPQQFDHMISVVRLGRAPSEWLWLDATNPFAAPGYLLPTLRDKPAILVDADGTAVAVRTPRDPPFPSRHEVTFKGRLEADGLLRGRQSWALRSDAEVMLRALFSSVPEEQRAAVVKESLARDAGDATLQNVFVSDPLDSSSPLRIEFDLERRLSSSGGERMLAPPLPAPELPAADDPELAGEPAARFDVRETAGRAEIEIAEGLTSRAPLSVTLERPFGAFRSSYSVEGRTLKVERTLWLSQPSLAAGDLPGYRSFRSAVETDNKQEFAIEGVRTVDAGAAAWHREGLAAFARKQYDKAAELLRKAADADPRRTDVFEDLGRALHEQGRQEEAAAAFTRQIETTPFHESAYAWRGYVLQKLDRQDEAEKDLLKQIEVAPFKAWSYERMGERREAQGRLAEAVDFFARAAAIEPKDAERWIALGWAQAAASRPADARASLDRALALDAEDWMKVAAAASYHLLGDVARAGEVAAAALAPLRQRLSAMSASDLQGDATYWTEQLVQAWTLVGEAAAASGDLPRAQRYLESAWTTGFLPEAGCLLGEVRQKQGRGDEAALLWRMAAAVGARPDRGATCLARIRAAGRLPARRPLGDAEANDRLMKLRTVRLAGPVAASLSEEVLLLTDGEGKVQSMASVSHRDEQAFSRQVVKLESMRLPAAWPDGERSNIVRRALLACSTLSGCAFVLDLPGSSSLTAWRR